MEDTVFYIFVFLLGLAIGSFLNVVIYRLPRGLSIWQGRSFCPKCGKKLSWWENIPLFSYLFLKGRCSKCSARISFQYPLVEFLTGIIFLLAFYKIFSSPSSLTSYFLLHTSDFLLHASYFILLTSYFILISCLIAIFFIDLKHYIIPDSLIVIGSITSLVYLSLGQFLIRNAQSLIQNSFFNHIFPAPDFLAHSSLFINHLIFAIIGGAFFALIVLMTRGKGMGVGDVKLAALMGLILGDKLIPAFYLAFISGALVGLLLIACKKKSLSSKIPFGPFLAGATLLLMIL